MPAHLIDVWSVATFDEALRQHLSDHTDLIRSYFDTDHRIFLDHDLGRGPPRIIRPSNPHYDAFERLETAVNAEMGKRTMRAFHYTRLDDAEVDLMCREGIELSTPDTLRKRIAARVAAGFLAPGDIDLLLQASPFQQQLKNRSGMFWRLRVTLQMRSAQSPFARYPSCPALSFRDCNDARFACQPEPSLKAPEQSATRARSSFEIATLDHGY